MEWDDLSNREIGCAIEVHRLLGHGLHESAYERLRIHEAHWWTDVKLAEMQSGQLMNFNLPQLVGAN